MANKSSKTADLFSFGSQEDLVPALVDTAAPLNERFATDFNNYRIEELKDKGAPAAQIQRMVERQNKVKKFWLHPETPAEVEKRNRAHQLLKGLADGSVAVHGREFEVQVFNGASLESTMTRTARIEYNAEAKNEQQMVDGNDYRCLRQLGAALSMLKSPDYRYVWMNDGLRIGLLVKRADKDPIFVNTALQMFTVVKGRDGKPFYKPFSNERRSVDVGSLKYRYLAVFAMGYPLVLTTASADDAYMGVVERCIMEGIVFEDFRHEINETEKFNALPFTTKEFDARFPRPIEEVAPEIFSFEAPTAAPDTFTL